MNTLFQNDRRRWVALAFVIVLAGCGGGGGSADQEQTSAEALPGNPAPTPAPNFSQILLPQDTLFYYQWHLKNTGQIAQPHSQRRGKSGVDLNVQAVWDQGIEGNGVTVAVLDDGLDIHHKDLKNNIVEGLSFNFFNNSHDPTPSTASDSHGTAVAGIIAAERGNGVIGVAPKARLVGFDILERQSGMRLSKKVITALKAGVEDGSIDISNNSWGNYNGSVASAELLKQLYDATQYGVDEGRGRKGVVYTFAAGNERYGPVQFKYVQPGYGWANSDESSAPYVLSICAIDAHGQSAPYSDYGSNLLVCGLSNGGKMTPYTTTTALNNRYRHDFGGTSAATPMVSGVVALMLDANPELTWRDVRLALANTARILPSMRGEDAQWITTKGINPITQLKREYSHIYGFGLVDTHAAVEYVKKKNGFKSVGGSSEIWWQSNACHKSSEVSSDSTAGTDSLTHSIEMECGNKQVEFVKVELFIEHSRFRDLKITLTTPAGTEMTLTDYYPYCGSKGVKATHCPTSDFNHQYVTSVTAPLGEPANGHWVIRVFDKSGNNVLPKVRLANLTIH